MYSMQTSMRLRVVRPKLKLILNTTLDHASSTSIIILSKSVCVVAVRLLPFSNYYEHPGCVLTRLKT